MVDPGGTLFSVSRSGSCGDFRWRVTFGSAVAAISLPLLIARFSDATVGAARFTNVSRLRASVETVVPLPPSTTRVPISVPSAMCASYDTIADNFDRNVTFPLVVHVRSRVAACGLDALSRPSSPGFSLSKLLCTVDTRPDVSPVVLSVIPEQGGVCIFVRALYS